MDATSRRALLKMGAAIAAGLGLGRLRAMGQTPAPPSTQPGAASGGATSKPAGDAGLRRPQQAEVLKNLLSRQDRPVPVPIEPVNEKSTPADRGIGPDGQPLLLEGSFIVERPGRVERDGDGFVFAFLLDPSSSQMRRMRIVPNQLLETIEYELTGGFEEFIVSGEILRYRGQNFLLVRKVLRRTPHGNLSP